MADNLGQHTQSSGFRVAGIHGGRVMGMLPFTGVLIRVTEVVTTTTVFKAELLENMGLALGTATLDDLFNAGWKIKGIKTANNNGVIVDITDFATATGAVTTAAMSGGTYVVGDVLALAPDEIMVPIGQPVELTKTPVGVAVGTGGVGGARVTGGTPLSGAVAGGNIRLTRASVQVLGVAAPTGVFTGLYLSVVRAGAIILNVKFTNPDGLPFLAADAARGGFGIAELNHTITTGDVIKVYTETVAISDTTPTFAVSGTVLTAGASLAAA